MRFLPITLLLFCCSALHAQTARFLERKDYDPQHTVSGKTRMFFTTINKANTKLAVCGLDTEVDATSGKLRMVSDSRIVDLTTGRMQPGPVGTQYFFVNDDLIVVELVGAGNWLKVGELYSTNSYYQDAATGERRKVDLPAGFQLVGVQSGFVVITSFESKKTIVMEEKNGTLVARYTLDVIMPRLPKNGRWLVGVKDFIANDAMIYELATGKHVHSLKVSGLTSGVLRNGNIIYQAPQKLVLASPDAKKVLKEFPHSVLFFELNESETEMVSVDSQGFIYHWDLTKGELLTKVRDTYIGEAFAKFPGVPVPVSGGRHFLVAWSNNLVSVYSTVDRAIVANLYFDKEDWAVIAKDGRVDGTAGAFEKLEWREYNGDKLERSVSLESTFDKYFTPRLLYSIFTGEPTAAQVAIDLKKTNLPVLTLESIASQSFAPSSGVVTYASQQKNIPIRIRASANNDQVSEVRMYHNGKLVANVPGNQAGVYDFAVSLNSVNGENNPIYVIAGTKSGVDSEKCKILVQYKETVNRKANLYALVIGVNKYQNPRYELNYAMADATAFKDQLERSKSALFETVKVTALFDGQVTKEGINNAFRQLATSVTEQDVFMFYYAGHGTMMERDASQEFYIVPHDVTQLYGNEALLKEKGLSATELKALSMNLNAQKQIFIIDACHSAGALGTAATRGAVEERAIAQLARSTGTIWLTAAGSDQFATEFAQLGHGVFTYSLLEVLQGKDPGSAADGTITARELSSYVERRVPELSQQYKGKVQYPASFSFGNDFPVVIKRE